MFTPRALVVGLPEIRPLPVPENPYPEDSPQPFGYSPPPRKAYILLEIGLWWHLSIVRDEIGASVNSSVNILLKYADDTSLLVPSDSDTDLVDEFDNIKRWAAQNHMAINLQKTKELVFRRPNPRLVLPVPLDQIEQVHCAKLLGIYLSDCNLKPI